MKESLLLIGAGGHTNACIDVIELENRFIISGIVGQKSDIGKKILGYRVIASDDDLETLFSQFKNAFIGIGQIKNFELRYKLYNKLKSIGFNLPSIISPRSYVSKSAKIGEGTIIMHNALLNQNVTIGNNCIINTGAIIEHDVRIGDQTHISTACVLNGGVTVGDFTFVGSGTVVRESVSVGSEVIIGMSNKVFKNVPDGIVCK